MWPRPTWPLQPCATWTTAPSYGDALHTSVHRGIQLDAVREMLEQIKEILE